MPLQFNSFIQQTFTLNYYAIPFLITALLFISMGVYVLAQSPRSPLHLSFFGICLSATVWLACTFLIFISKQEAFIRPAIKGLYLGVSFISVSVYTYSSIWLRYSKNQRPWIVLGYSLSVLLTLLIWFTPWIVSGYAPHAWGNYSLLTPWGGAVYILFFAAYMLGFFINFWKGYRLAKTPLQRQQTKLVLLGFVMAYIGIVDFLPCYRIEVFPIGAFTTFFLVCTLAYSIVRYKLLDIQTVLHKTLMWAALSSLVLVPLGLTFYCFRDSYLYLHPVVSSALGVGLFLLFMAYARTIQPRIDHIFQRRKHDLEQELIKFNDNLVHLKGLPELARYIVQTLQAVLYVGRIQVFLKHGENQEIIWIDGAASKTLRMNLEMPFLRWLEREDQLVQADFIDLDPRFRGIQQEAKAFFHELQVDVCIPLVLDRELVGMIHLGEKLNLKPYRAHEIRFLSEFRRAATIACSNSLHVIEMQESLRKWNAELEEKVRQRTRELEETQRQLIQAEKLASIGTLAGGIAHEINNPLTAVLTNVQMLKLMGEAPDPESLGLIEEGAKRCQVIIQKLMRYARKSEEIENYIEVDINKIIRNVCDFLGYQLKQENIEVDLGLGELGLILGIANELEQVFTNLFVNSRDAIKAAGREGKIVIKTGQRGNDIQVEFTDNGTGIRREHLARIFDPFYTTKDVGAGTGLGLTVASGIVEKHRGKISVTSTVGEGTTFHIQFPAAKIRSISTEA